MTAAKTAELDDVLEQFDFAETITRDIGALTVTLAEAHSRRNAKFGASMFVVIHARKAEGKEVTEDDEIDVFCATILRSWNLTVKGKPIAVGKDAAAVLKRSTAGRNLYREMSALASTQRLYKAGTSKKRPSSKSTRKRSKSVTSQKPSSRNAKSASGSPLKESKTT